MDSKSIQIEDIRKDYRLYELHESSVHHDPISQFKQWFEEALTAQVNEVNAMTLATVDDKSMPDARIVLLKNVDTEGFRFFTNYNSSKAQQLIHNSSIALVFFWPELERQIRIRGAVQRLSFEEADRYFRSRPKGSQLGAWASPQSETIADRTTLQYKYDELAVEYADSEIPTPKHWGGFLVSPNEVEFWQGRTSRLHDRILYKHLGGHWKISRLAP